MKGIVDRIEGGIVVCEMEDKQMLDIDIAAFAVLPKDGDSFEYQDGIATILKEETEIKKADVKSMFERLKKK